MRDGQLASASPLIFRKIFQISHLNHCFYLCLMELHRIHLKLISFMYIFPAHLFGITMVPLWQSTSENFLVAAGELWHSSLCVEVFFAAAAAKSLQSCPTLCDSIDGSPPGSPVPGILQARTLEWVAISFSKAWKWKVKVKSFSPVPLLATPWTAAYQAPLPIRFSSQEY